MQVSVLRGDVTVYGADDGNLFLIKPQEFQRSTFWILYVWSDMCFI